MTKFKKEGDVKRVTKVLLDKHKWFWWMTPANGFGKSGISDILAFKAGTLLAIETKFNGNTPSPMQKGFLTSIQSESGFAFVVDEHNITSLQMWLEAYDRAVGAQILQKEVAPEDGAMMLNAMKVLTAAF